jgi:hypothetical protein
MAAVRVTEIAAISADRYRWHDRCSKNEQQTRREAGAQNSGLTARSPGQQVAWQQPPDRVSPPSRMTGRTGRGTK